MAMAVILGRNVMASDDTNRPGFIAGKVVDLDGHAVASAHVWIASSEEKKTETHAGADGIFRLGPMQSGVNVVLWMESENLAREHSEPVPVFSGIENDIGTFTLSPGRRIEGRVIDQKGNPVPGAEIRIESHHHVLGHTISNNGPGWTLTAGADGSFTSPVLPAGNCDVTASAPNKTHGTAWQAVDPGAGTYTLEPITLNDDVPIRGIMVNEKGEPIANARVKIDYDYQHEVRTGADGRFEFRGFDRTAKNIHASAASYVDLDDKLGGDFGNLRVVMKKAFEIRGMVLDDKTGKPVKFDRIQLCTVERKDGAVRLLG
jgi:hypothetical protein